MKRGIFITWLVATLLICPTTSAMAQGGRIHFGDLEITTGMAVRGNYDDNIYLGNGSNKTTELEESDWITHIIPSLLLDYALPDRGSLSLGYKGDFAYYADNDQNDWTRHQVTSILNYLPPGGLIFEVDNLFIDTEDPYSSENQYRLGAPQVERWYDRLKTKAGCEFNEQFRLLGYYNFYKQDYDHVIDFSQDYKSHEFGAGVHMRLFPQTWSFLRYHYGERDYFTHPEGTGVTESNDSDFDWHRVNGGLTWDATAKLSGELNFGYEWKDYDNEFDVDNNRYDDKETWIASTFLSFKATPVATLSVSVTRALRETGSATNEYFEDTGVGVNLAYVFRSKTTVHVGGLYSSNDYNVPVDKQREDDNYKAKISLDYQIQDWLSVGIGYQYWEKDSNYPGNDFTDNRFMVSVNLVY